MQKIFVLSANDRRIFLGLLLSGIVANHIDDCNAVSWTTRPLVTVLVVSC